MTDDIVDRGYKAIHRESAAIAPRTSEMIECLRCALEEIERLRSDREKINVALTRALCGYDKDTALWHAPDRVPDLLKEIERLHRLLTHARADLGECIDAEHRHRADYPDEMRRYERDMALCYEIDKVLGNPDKNG